MDVQNCRSCGRLFNYYSGDMLCPTCLQKLDEKFLEVKEYIYNHPGAGIQEVANENDISMSQIKKWVRQERLEFTKDSAVGIDCESCGASITTGRFCKKCKNRLAQEINSLYKKDAFGKNNANEREDARMRFLK